MSFKFNNKRILIISQQPWGEVHISKHHYALELLRMGNDVFFLNPPDDSLSTAVKMQTTSEGVKVVSYKPAFPFIIRFHARPVFDFLMRRQVRKILQVIGANLDVVWCFEFNLFTNLNLFRAPIKIYHPVDPVSASYHIAPARSATLVFSVSHQILDSFKGVPTPAHVINHGLASVFVEPPVTPCAVQIHSPVKVGYVGNLGRSNVDISLFRELITRHPDVQFHIIGPSTAKSNLGGDASSESDSFMDFISKAPNVICHGSKPPSTVASMIREMDAFLLCYRLVPGIYDLSNSHKILEYLSTGKTVISNLISSYAKSDLLLMGTPEQLPGLFEKVIADLPHYNSLENQKKRIAFATNNTYRKQIERVESCLSGLGITG